MTLVGWLSIAFGLAGIAFGARCYWELKKWARQCQGLRIAVSFKRRVVLQAPLVEWLLWGNLLDKDKDSNGRVVYKMGGTTIAIIKRSHKAPKENVQAQAEMKQGTWSASDETVKT